MRLILIALAFAAACSSTKICDEKIPGTPPSCGAGVVPDPTASACHDDTGSAFICRGGAGYCVVCTGTSFEDGCAPNTNGGQSYCVHDCSNC